MNAMNTSLPDHDGIQFSVRHSGGKTEVSYRDRAGKTHGLRSASMPAERMREILIEALDPRGRTLLAQKRTVR